MAERVTYGRNGRHRHRRGELVAAELPVDTEAMELLSFGMITWSVIVTVEMEA